MLYVTLLGMTTLFSTNAAASEPVDQTVTLTALRAASLIADVEYEHRIGERGGVAGRASIGGSKPLSYRLANAISGMNLFDFGGMTAGVGAGYDFYTKEYTRGFYLGANVGVDYYNVQSQIADFQVGRFSITPHIGWRVIAPSGFTFAMELGGGYAAVVGGDNTPLGSELFGFYTSNIDIDTGLHFGWSF